MSKLISKPQNVSLASQLFSVQAEITRLEEDEKRLKEELLNSLQKQGVKFVRLSNGIGYSVTLGKTSLEVKKGQEEKAWLWATKHNALKIDTAKALEILRREIKTPTFFLKKVANPHLTITKPRPSLHD